MSEELDDIGIKMYVGLINPNEGLDASGPLTDHRFDNLLKSYYGRKYIPAIFDNKGDLPSNKEKAISKEARVQAMKDSRAKGWATDETIRGIRMRQQMAHVPGEIVIAPVPIEALEGEKIKGGDSFEKAKLLLQMATHILDGREVVKIDQDEKQDLIDEMEFEQKKQEKRRQRKAKRSGN